MFSAIDHSMMARALRLAEQGLYTTTPNPRVGCVIVKDGHIVGEGAHLKAGEPHAEIHALRQAGGQAAGADVYVTLEPCSHHGRTPPCADALLQAGVKRVVAAMQDPNPLVAGQGLARLAAQGIATASGLMQAQAYALNPGFISRMTRGLPYVRSKIAASLDGQTGLHNGISQWITAAPARQDVQHWRAQACAILTGVGTVIADDPQLSVRDLVTGTLNGRQPLRVVVDSQLRTPVDAKILAANTVLAFVHDPERKSAALAAKGVQLWALPAMEGRIDLQALLRNLAESGINEVLVEAGNTLNGALQAASLVDEYLLYYAPLLLGSGAQPMFAGAVPFESMQQRINLQPLDTRQVGVDLRIRAKVCQPES